MRGGADSRAGYISESHAVSLGARPPGPELPQRLAEVVLGHEKGRRASCDALRPCVIFRVISLLLNQPALGVAGILQRGHCSGRVKGARILHRDLGDFAFQFNIRYTR